MYKYTSIQLDHAPCIVRILQFFSRQMNASSIIKGSWEVLTMKLAFIVVKNKWDIKTFQTCAITVCGYLIITR